MKTKLNVRLEKPNPRYRESFYEYIEEIKSNNEISELGNAYRENETFETMIIRLENRSKGIDINPKDVPSSIYWIINNDDRVIGSIDLRHELNQSYFERNGNVAYIIKPSERGKGYATDALFLAKEKYKQNNVLKILVTCFKDNIASAKVIEKNGGILEQEIKDPWSDNVIQRWWITL